MKELQTGRQSTEKSIAQLRRSCLRTVSFPRSTQRLH